MADAADGSDNRGGPARESLPEPTMSGIIPPLVKGIGLLLDIQAGIARDRDQGGSGNSWQDRSKRRRHDGPVLHHEEDVHSTQLFDPTMFRGIQEDDLITSLLRRLRLRDETAGVVSTAFGRSRTTLGSPAEGIGNPNRDRLLAASEVSPGRARDYAKRVLGCG